VLGLLVVLGLAYATQYLNKYVPVWLAKTNLARISKSVEFPIYAIALGLLGNLLLSVLRIRDRLSGAFRTEFFIKTGLVLLGLSINLSLLVTAAGPAIVQALVLISSVFLFTWWIAGKLGLDDKLRALLASRCPSAGSARPSRPPGRSGPSARSSISASRSPWPPCCSPTSPSDPRARRAGPHPARRASRRRQSPPPFRAGPRSEPATVQSRPPSRRDTDGHVAARGPSGPGMMVPMTAARIALGGVLVVTGVLAGCATPTTTTADRPGSATSATPTSATAAVLPAVSLTRTGGFAGVNQTIVITAAGAWTFTDKRSNATSSGQFTQPQLVQLAQLALDPRVAQEVLQSPSAGACSDAFNYTLAIGPQNTTFEDCGGARPAIHSMVAFITDATDF
jgi:hypothetical protein